MVRKATLKLVGALLFSTWAVAGPEDHAEKAARLAQQGDLKNAEGELRKAIALSPEDPALLTSLGGILAMEGKLQQASVYLAKAVKLNPQDSVARRNLAANQWQLGKLKEARQNLERLLRADAQDRATIFLLGMVCEKEKDYARSAALLESVPDVVDQQPDGWAALASSYYHTNRRTEAGSALRKLLNRSRSPRASYLAGRVAMEARDYPAAEALFLSIRTAYSDPAEVEFQIALAQYRDNRAADSEKTLLDAARAKRANRDSYLLLCRMIDEGGASDRALQMAAQANEAFPDSYEILRMKASLEMKLRYFSQAAGSYQRAAMLDRGSSEIQRLLAAAEWRAGMRQQAVSDFEKAMLQFPRDAAVLQAYGALLLESGSAEDRPRGVDLLKRAIDLNPSSVEPRYLLANTELENGKPEQALAYLESAIKLDPRDSRLHFALSRAYRRLGRSAEADKEMENYQSLKALERPGAQNGSPQETKR